MTSGYTYTPTPTRQAIGKSQLEGKLSKMRDNQSHSIPRIVTATTLGEILSLMELAMQYTVVIHSDTQMQTSVTASIVKNLIRKLISNHFG